MIAVLTDVFLEILGMVFWITFAALVYAIGSLFWYLVKVFYFRWRYRRK